MKLVYDDGFASSHVCSYSGINVWCIYYHCKVSSINGKIFFQNLRKAPPPFKIFFPFQKYVTRKYTINYSIFPLSLSLDFFQHSHSPKYFVSQPWKTTYVLWYFQITKHRWEFRHILRWKKLDREGGGFSQIFLTT